MLRNHRLRAPGKAVLYMSVALLLTVSLLGSAFGPGTQTAAAQAGPQFALSSVIATINGVNLRDQPAASGSVITVLPVNTRALVKGGPFNDNWYWIDADGTLGYAQGRNFVQVDANYTPVATETSTPVGTPVTRATATATATSTAPSPVATNSGQQGTPAPVATQPSTTGTPAPNIITTPSTPGDYTGLWLAELTVGGNVRTGPGLDKPVMKGWWPGRRVLLYQAVTDSKGNVWYPFQSRPSSRCGCTRA